MISPSPGPTPHGDPPPWELATSAVSIAAVAASVASTGATTAWLSGAPHVPGAIPAILWAATALQAACARLARATPSLGGQLSAATWVVADLLLVRASPPTVGLVVGPLGLMAASVIGTISATPGTWAWGGAAVAAWAATLALVGPAPEDVVPLLVFPSVILGGTTLLLARMVERLWRGDRSLRDALATVEARSAEADRANRAKSEFLASMSHELRTPLNAIIGYAELLADEGAEPGVRRDADRIRGSGRHLLALVDDLLDMAKIEAGRLELAPEPFDPRALLAELLPVAESLTRDRGNALRWEVDPTVPEVVVADALRLRQVLLNLVGNALKFTAAGTVRVRAWGTPDALAVAIADDGPGIDADTRARLFRPFAQGKDRGTKARGSGLGLAISRELVTRMGGTVALVSPPGPGSTFEVRLPLRADRPPPPPTP